MIEWLSSLLGQKSPLQQELHLAGNAKAIFSGFSALLTLTTNKFTAPFQDDMPFPFKLLLVAMTAGEAFLLPALGMEPVRIVTILLVTGVIALLLYLICYWVWGYKKIVDVPAGFFRAQRYKEVTILGGLRLRAAAQAHTGGDAAKIQTFLADNAYDQDVLWSRPSRLPVQIVAVLAYATAVVSLTGVLWAVTLG